MVQNQSSERAVQSMVLYLRGRCIEQGSTEAWSLDIRGGVVFTNTRSQKVYVYAPAQLMLEFSPQMKHFDVEWEPAHRGASRDSRHDGASEAYIHGSTALESVFS